MISEFNSSSSWLDWTADTLCARIPHVVATSLPTAFKYAGVAGEWVANCRIVRVGLSSAIIYGGVTYSHAFFRDKLKNVKAPVNQDSCIEHFVESVTKLAWMSASIIVPTAIAGFGLYGMYRDAFGLNIREFPDVSVCPGIGSSNTTISLPGNCQIVCAVAKEFLGVPGHG